MKISYKEFESLAYDYVRLNDKNDEYLASVPRDIKNFIFDNEYANNIINQSNLFLELLLGVVLYEDFMWFLYDKTIRHEYENDDPNIIVDGRKYYIHNLVTYLNYVKFEYFNNKE